MLEQFYERITPNSVAVLFFSGYAITSDRQSYLIPVDAQIWTEADVASNGLADKAADPFIKGRLLDLVARYEDDGIRPPTPLTPNDLEFTSRGTGPER